MMVVKLKDKNSKAAIEKERLQEFMMMVVNNVQ